MRQHSAWPEERRARSGHTELVVARVRPFVQKALKTSRLRPSRGYVNRPFHIQRPAGLAYAELAARPHHGSVCAAETFERRMPKKLSRCGVGHHNSKNGADNQKISLNRACSGTRLAPLSNHPIG